MPSAFRKRFNEQEYFQDLEADLEQFLPANADRFSKYQFDATGYIREILKWTPWAGDEEHPGQQEIINQYCLALRQMTERDAFTAGELTEDELTIWKPGTIIQNRLRVEAGHGVGKTMLAAGLVNHFTDCFVPSITYTFAPTWRQIHDLLWKEIKTARRKKDLPGRLLDLELRVADDHFATGVAASNAGGLGTERVHGQHGKYLLFVLDEAEGVADYVYDAVQAMTTGGIAIILLLANPRTRLSKFYRQRELPTTKNFRLACIYTPNVLQDKEIVPNATRREYVEEMIADHCSIVEAHDPSLDTFEVPWRPGIIYVPDAEFMFRVLGKPPTVGSDTTLISLGAYEAALRYEPTADDRPLVASMGVDCGGYGGDLGTVYVRHNARVWRAATMSKAAHNQDPTDYYVKVKDQSVRLAAKGVKFLHIRVDAGGGYGNGLADMLKRDEQLKQMFVEFKVILVNFQTAANDEKAYADLGTEMYAHAAETLKGIRILNAPESLETDLCQRLYENVNVKGVEVKRLESKKAFRKEHNRSPDDGDGFVLCVAPNFLFKPTSWAHDNGVLSWLMQRR